MFKFRGKRPKTLGIHNGELYRPSSKPNSVCSHAQGGYAAIAPLAISGDAADAWARLRGIVEGEAEIIESNDHYLYAEYTTPLMGYVDDVEFLLDAEHGVIHLRSASRLGYSDMGANRKRIEAIRKRFEQ